MNNNTHIQIDFQIQNFKIFLLKECPIEELDGERPDLESNNVRDIVIGYRINDLSLLDALQAFENPEWKPLFDSWVCQNMFLNNLILLDELEE
jgi:hypothetical protein